jgi:hypothetical protein
MRIPTPVRPTRRAWPPVLAALLLLAVGVTACGQSKTSEPVTPAPAAVSDAAAAQERLTPSSSRDLAPDEAMGGHTLARHVGRSDDQLRERLRREPDISSASTYTDRATAEAVVGAALSSAPRSFDSWRRRSGRRPNFVLHFPADHVIGRVMTRRQPHATPSSDALIVVRWDERSRQFFVLTSYPEERR